MGKKKPNNAKRNRGSKDATALQQQQTDRIVVDDASSSSRRRSVVKTSSADNIGDNVDLEDATPSTTTTTSSTSAPNNIAVAVAGVNAVIIRKKANSSDDAPATSSSFSSSEKQRAPLTDDTSLFLGNPSMEMKDDRHGSVAIINGAQRGCTNDNNIAIQQPPNNNMIAEQQQHVEGAVVYNNEGAVEERNNSVEGGATTTTTTTTTTTSADNTKRVHWRSSTSLVDVISSFSEDEDPQTARRDKSVTINEDVALDIDAEASTRSINNTMSEQWITKLIRILLARSCCYKVVRHDSTTPR